MGYKKACIWIPLILLIVNHSFGQIPAGYYDAAISKSGDSLRKALSIITANGHNKLSYSNIWNFFDQTDLRLGTTDKILDMYSDIPGGTPAYIYTFGTNQCTGGTGAEGVCYSREHCFPNSWWGGFDDSGHPQYTDLHHLFPADQYVNQYKSNNPIGQITIATKTFTNSSKYGTCSYPGYSGNVYEPIDAYKGDFARAWFYIATRYRDSLSGWVKNYKKPEAIATIDSNTSNYKQWFRDMLLSWHNSDPVSVKETNRNNVIYNNTYQHNRNPFIDHPEYVNLIWGSQAIVIKPEPLNHVTNLQANTSYPYSSSITLTWTDATGSVIPDGYLIKAQAGGYNNIQSPIDGTPEINAFFCKNVSQGTQTVTFTGLISDTTYYFKIFPYTNSDTNINYKINGNIPLTYDTTLIWKEDFETGVKGSYAIGNVNCTMGNWTLNDALLGTLSNDKKNGSKSVRGGAFTIYMNFDKAGGAGNITIYKAKYGSDASTLWKLLKSTDNGINWIIIKDSILTSETILTPITIPVNQEGDVRFMFLTYNGSQTKRTNFDDIIITNYSYVNQFKALKIKCFLEGLYNGTNMNPVQNENGNQWSADIAEKITVVLKDSLTPYPVVYTDTNVLVDINGFALIDSIPVSLTSKYYLVIKNRNHLETWSATPIQFNSDTTIYDFTSSASKAYGDNLKNIHPLSTSQFKSYIFNNISELKKQHYKPDRFIITIYPTNDTKVFDVIVIDKITNKKYIKKVTEELLFLNGKTDK